jgi:molybdopterin/thiamine biosynthesis adenylyltransferase
VDYFDACAGRAVEEVSIWLATAHPGATEVSAEALTARSFPNARAGWRVSVPNLPHVILILDRGFPYEPALVIVEGAENLSAPHVETGQKLCLDGDDARVNSADPIGIVRHALERAFSLLALNEQRALVDDFQNDFQAYWSRASTGKAAYSLLPSTAGSRRGWIYSHGSFQLAATSREDGERWMTNRFGASGWTRSPSLILWLDPLPAPSRYPRSVADLKALAPTMVDAIDELLSAASRTALCIIRGPGAGKSIHGGVVELTAAKSKGWTGSRPRGFRPGRSPAPQVNGQRWTLTFRKLLAVDSASNRLPDGLLGLKDRRATIIGCGALGSGIARLLVQSGIGELRLLDPDLLGFNNIGRHELGADAVGHGKASTLAGALKRGFPHVFDVIGKDKDWLQFIADEGEGAFDGDDLVISATGDWNADSALNDFQRARGLRAPVLYSWLEQNAGAAHAVGLASNGQSCLRCGFNDLGILKIPVTRWRKPPEIEGCASPTSPFGAIELAFAQALVAELATDLLLGSAAPGIRRTWIAQKSFVESQGGRWNRSWIDSFGNPGNGGRAVAAEWPAQEGCPHGI